MKIFVVPTHHKWDDWTYLRLLQRNKVPFIVHDQKTGSDGRHMTHIGFHNSRDQEKASSIWLALTGRTLIGAGV